ncbi:MAG: phospholipid carrier-dependent glycosyltransferase [Candidatus Doudnabacteria bacterium]|jgi:4-amino-4-deoxy-L-arabinose transferase-like glycosyltransferase
MENIKKFDFKKYLLTGLSVLLIAGYGGILFYKLGNNPVVDWDEGIYAQVARQSFDTNSVADLHYYASISPQNPNGFWFEKPPLMIWLTQISYVIFGVTEFAVRFWNALFALGVVILSYFFALRLFKSQVVGLLAVATFYLAHFFISQSLYLKFDIPVTFFILLSFLFFDLALENKKFFLWFWVAIGLGVMTKSVIGLLPLPIVFLQALITQNFTFLKQRNFYYGIGLFLLIVVPWHLIETVRHGSVFWQTYLGYHILSRYAHQLESNGAPFWYFVSQMKQNLLFAGFSALSAIYFLTRAIKNKTTEGFVFISTAVIFIFLFFSLSRTKLPSYIVVVYPFLAIMIAKTIVDIFSYSKKNLINVVGMVFVSAIFIISGVFYNASKINNQGYYARHYYENKAFMEFVSQNYPDLPILVNGRDIPAIMFYADKRIYNWSPATKISPGSFIYVAMDNLVFPNAQLLSRGQTGNLYLVTIKN